MKLNVDPGFDADLELAYRAMERGWVTRQAVESAILVHEKTPGSRLLSHLPLTPDQLARLKSPGHAAAPPEIAAAANDPARRVEHFVLGEFLHSGGMGRVHKAWDLKLSRWVALKFMKGVGDERSAAYFEREARLAAGLSHPNIAAIYESGLSTGERYIAMQFIPGKTLEKAEGRNIPERVRLIRDAARAVAHANERGVIHRDIKPSNLMVSPDGRIYVLDFGLARPVDADARHSATGKAMGTPAYMSPEQAKGAAVDARADVYGLGATLYECLTGRPPFRGATIYDVLRQVEEEAPPRPRRLAPRIATDLETIVLKCLEKDPARRYATADELADDLDRFLRHDAIQARPASALYRVRRGLAKRKSLVLALAASTFLAGALGWWLLVGRPRSEHLRLRESAMKLWAEARGAAMAGGDAEGIARRAKAAREAFDRAIAALEDPQAHLMRGRCLQLEGRPQDEIGALERAHALDPDDAEIRIELAKALLTRYQASRGYPSEYTVINEKDADVSLETRAMPDETAAERRLRERGAKLLAAGGAAPFQASLLKGLLEMGKGEHRTAAVALGVYTRVESWDAQTLWLEGICRYFAGDLEEAIAAFDRSLARVPDAVAFRWRGSAKEAGGLHDEAIADFSKAIEADPASWAAYNSRGLVRVVQGDHDAAIADCTKALELNPRAAIAANNRGSAKAMKGQLHEAVLDYSRAIELEPDYAGPHSNRGLARLAQGRTDEAIADFTEAIRIDPNHVVAWYNRAIAYSSKKMWAEAIADSTKAVELDPRNPKALTNLGRAQDERGFTDEALALYAKALEIDPDLPEARFNRGLVQARKKMFEEAIADFTRTIEIDPKHAEAFAHRGMAKLVQGLRDDAIADFTKAVEIDPALEEAWFHRGLANIGKKRADEAIADFTRVIDLNPQNERAYSNRGTERLRKGLTDEAIRDFTKAVEINPKFAEAWYNRSTAHARKRMRDEAIADLTRVIELQPRNANALTNRGAQKNERGLREEAVEDWTRALELDPNLPEAWFNRGSVRLHQGRMAEGIEDLRKALEVTPAGARLRGEIQLMLARGEAEHWFQEGGRHLDAKRYREAVGEYVRLVEKHPESRHALPSAYNAACGFARLGEKSNALVWLEKAVEMGWTDAGHIEKDPDLESLRAEASYKRLLARLKSGQTH